MYYKFGVKYDISYFDEFRFHSSKRSTVFDHKISLLKLIRMMIFEYFHIHK